MIPYSTLPEVILTLAIGLALAPLIGRYIANVYSGRQLGLGPDRRSDRAGHLLADGRRPRRAR